MTTDYHQAYVRLRSQPTGDWLVHPDLRDRLVESAAERETNLTEIAIEILSTHYGVEYVAAGRKTGPRQSAEVLNMRIPIGIWDRVRRAALKNRRRDMDEVRNVLCDHFDLVIPEREKEKV